MYTKRVCLPQSAPLSSSNGGSADNPGEGALSGKEARVPPYTVEAGPTPMFTLDCDMHKRTTFIVLKLEF